MLCEVFLRHLGRCLKNQKKICRTIKAYHAIIEPPGSLRNQKIKNSSHNISSGNAQPVGWTPTGAYMHTCIDYWHPCIYMHAVIHDSCMCAPCQRSYTLPETPKFIRQRPFSSGNAHTVNMYRVYSHTCRFAFSRAQACNHQ